MTAQANLNTQELLDKINSLVHKKRQPNDIDIADLKKEAGKLKNKISYPDYCDYLGQIACLENDKVNMLGHYKNAIANSFNKNLEIKKNYFISLYRCGLIIKASEQLKEIAENFSTYPNIIPFLIDNNFDLCRFRNALSLCESLENKPEFFNTIEKAVSIFESAGLSDDKAQHLCELAYSILEKQNLYYSNATVEIIEDCVYYSIYVDVSIEESARIDFELSYLFAEKLDDMCDDVIVFEYKSVETLKL